jgi:polysaccharide export outer membrane protein
MKNDKIAGYCHALVVLTCATVLSSCALPGTGKRTAFYPYEREEAVPVHAASENGEVTSAGTPSRLDFYEFRRRNSPDPALLNPAGGVYLLGPGDRIAVEVVDTPKTREEVMVLPDGMLYYDMSDGVRAAGRNLRQVEAALAEQLREDYVFNMVSATLISPASRNYTVLGQVKKPGSYPLSKPTTLLEAIAEAGGSGSVNSGEALADLPRCVVIRGGEMLPVDFEALIQRGEMQHNIYLLPQDYIFMPAEGKDRVYVLGAVKMPKAVPYTSRLSVVGALASAQGLAQEAYPQGALVVRGSFSNPKFATTNLNKILRGQRADFKLLPGDIIWVPEKPWQKLSEYAKYGLVAAASSYSLTESSKIFFDYSEEDQSGSESDNSNSSVPSPSASTLGL